MTDPNLPSASSPKPGKSTGAKVAIGCGIGCFGLIVIAVIAGILGWSWFSKILKEFETEFQEKGMTLQSKAQMVVVDTPPTKPSYYVGQIVKVNTDIDVEIGIIAQVAEIHGTISEPVHFRGQIIQLKPGSRLKKGLDVKCQVIQPEGGTIDGEITGSYQSGPGPTTLKPSGTVKQEVEAVPINQPKPN